jgi:hypothetical protein
MKLIERLSVVIVPALLQLSRKERFAPFLAMMVP